MNNRLSHGGQIFQLCREYNLELNEVNDFSASINPNTPLIDWQELQIQANKKLIHYPELALDETSSKLLCVIANKFDTHTKDTILVNGISRAIHQLFCALRPEKTVLFAPIYSEYQIASHHHSQETIELRSKKDWQTAIEQNGNKLTPQSAVVLVNPNTPQGLYQKASDLKSILDYCHDHQAWLIVDESFLPFISFSKAQSFRQWVEKYPKLIVLQSLTKYYACPGIRIGAVFSSNPKIKKGLTEIWTISNLDELWLKQAMQDQGFDDLTHLWLRNAKPVFLEKLSLLSLVETVMPSDVNFVIVKFTIEVAKVQNELIKFKQFIRSLESFGYDEFHARIAIKSNSENQQLVTALESISMQVKQ